MQSEFVVNLIYTYRIFNGKILTYSKPHMAILKTLTPELHLERIRAAMNSIDVKYMTTRQVTCTMMNNHINVKVFYEQLTSNNNEFTHQSYISQHRWKLIEYIKSVNEENGHD